MNCPKCGSPVPEGSKFCESCGAEVTVETVAAATSEVNEAPAQQTVSQANNQQPSYDQGFKETSVQGSAIQLVQSVLGSPLMLVACVLYSVGVIIRIVRSAQIGSAVGSTATGGLPPFVSAIVSALPVVLIVIGLWLIYTWAASKTSTAKTSGITLIKVIVIIEFVLYMIVAVAALIACILMLAGTEDLFNGIISFLQQSGLGDYVDYILGIQLPFRTIYIVLIVMIIVIVVVLIIYYVKLIHTFNVTKRSIYANRIKGKMSAFVAVILILSGLGSISSVIVTKDFLSILSMVVTIATNVIFGIMIFWYNSKVKYR